MALHSFILGTAGHIDHGKTALVKALTGIDTDRLKEEQQRGITIELGFAHLTLDQTRFGIIDVPGHERFIKSMVAGAGGIDLAMLVIAADEGVMPQTREHLNICELLGIRHGFLALTKCDLVDSEWLSLVTEDIKQFLQGSFLEHAPIIPCSAITGVGVERLKETLLQVSSQLSTRDPHGLLRLPLDRIFSLKGFGTIVTGTLISGMISLGDEIAVMPSGIKGKVRGLQVHGESVECAVAGQRTAVNIGGVNREEVARGEVLVAPDTLEPSSIIEATVRLLSGDRKKLSSRSKVLFHQGTRQQEATCALLQGKPLEPGEQALAQLRFEKPIVALPHDRFILRGFHKHQNYGTTIGGGEVIHVLSRRIRPRDKKVIARIEKMQSASVEERVSLEILDAGPLGLTRTQLRRRLPLVPQILDHLLTKLRDKGILLRYDKDLEAFIHLEHFQKLSQRLYSLVKKFHLENPLESGISREELRSRLSLANEPRLFFALLQSLEKEGNLKIEKDVCYLPLHTVQKAAQPIQPLMEKIRAYYTQAGLAPPREAALVSELHTDASATSSAIKLLADEGCLVRLSDLFFARSALDDLRKKLIAYLESRGQITAQEFKEMVGQSRKFAIPLAEYFDAQKITLRVGDIRKLRR